MPGEENSSDGEQNQVVSGSGSPGTVLRTMVTSSFAVHWEMWLGSKDGGGVLLKQTVDECLSGGSLVSAVV